VTFQQKSALQKKKSERTLGMHGRHYSPSPLFFLLSHALSLSPLSSLLGALHTHSPGVLLISGLMMNLILITIAEKGEQEHTNTYPTTSDFNATCSILRP
jgi:hypothetical protein